MKSLHPQPADAQFIVPLFYGNIALNSSKPQIQKRFNAYIVQSLTSEKGLNYLEIQIENMILNCYLNSQQVCYTCWILINELENPESYVNFYNRYLTVFGRHKYCWKINNQHCAVEVVREKEGYYLVM